MNSLYRLAFPTILGLALSMTLVGQALASCSGGDRISWRDAECLEAWWENSGIRKSWRVRNLCFLTHVASLDPQTVVAKVDLKSHGDSTVWLNSSQWRRGTTYALKINWIYCCKDLGTCNFSELRTLANCQEQFDGPSTDRCRNTSVSISGGECSASAECQDHADNWVTSSISWTVDGTLYPIDACGNGRLQACPCSMGCD